MRNKSLVTSAICACLLTSSGVAVLCCDVAACLEDVTGEVINFFASSFAAGDRNKQCRGEYTSRTQIPPTSIFVIMCIIMVTITIIITIPLINRVRGPYCKLQTEFFPLGFKDRETRLVRYLLCLWVQIKHEDFSSNKILNLARRSVKYSSLNWLIIFHVPTKRCNQVWTWYSIFLWNKPLGS